MKNFLKNPAINNEKAFSLFELLAGIMIMSILMSSMYVVFQSASKVTTGGGDKSDVLQNLSIAGNMMSEEIQSAISKAQSPSGVDAPYLFGTNNTANLTFAGGSADDYDRDEISFCKPDSGGISEVGYQILAPNGNLTPAHEHIMNRFYTSSSGGQVDFDVDTLGTPNDFSDEEEIAYKICDLNILYEYYDSSSSSWKETNEWDSRSVGNTTGQSADDGKLPDYIVLTLRGIDKQTSIDNNNDPDVEYKKVFITRFRMTERRGT